jgi:hypothetical protein
MISYQIAYSQNNPDFIVQNNYYSHLREINNKLKIKSRERVIYYKNKFVDLSEQGFKSEEYKYDIEL